MNLLRAWSEPYWDTVNLLLRVEQEGHAAVGLPVVMKTLTPEDEGLAQRPTLTLSTHAAQVLMDDLWRCGLRPSEGSGSAGALAATQTHLKDMRAIAFTFLEKLGETKVTGEQKQ